MMYLKIIDYWLDYLGLDGWHIIPEEIKDEQVLYADDVPKEDRYFIGISRDAEKRTAVIYYSRPMTEEDILHELIHIRHPLYTEDEVNEYCDALIS